MNLQKKNFMNVEIFGDMDLIWLYEDFEKNFKNTFDRFFCVHFMCSVHQIALVPD